MSELGKQSGIVLAYVCFHLSGLSDFAFPGFQENEAAEDRIRAVSNYRGRLQHGVWRCLPTGLPPHFPQRSFRTKSPQCLQKGIRLFTKS